MLWGRNVNKDSPIPGGLSLSSVISSITRCPRQVPLRPFTLDSQVNLAKTTPRQWRWRSQMNRSCCRPTKHLGWPSKGGWCWPVFPSFRPSPFFLRLPSNSFPDIGSVGRIEKKKPTKKNHKKSRNSRPLYPRTTLKVNIHIFGLTKCTIYCENCSCFCSCFSLCCLLCSFFRLKELFQVKNGVTTSLLFFFFLKMPKIWSVGRR